MKSLDIYIDFARIDCYKTLIMLFENVHPLEDRDTLGLRLRFVEGGVFVHSDHLLAIVAIVSYLRERGVVVNIEVEGECSYAARVNFFQLLGVPYKENFVRRNNVGRFIELSRFTNETTYTLQDYLTVLLHQLPIAIEVRQLKFYCLAEIMDNVLIHSSLDHGWVCAQFYRNSREIRLMICDSGVGVLETLRNGERQEYRDVNGAEALELCIQRGVTNGLGLGASMLLLDSFS